MTNISPLAVVDPEAQIGQNTQIEPFVVIHKDVIIGDNCHIFRIPSFLMEPELVTIATFFQELSLPVFRRI